MDDPLERAPGHQRRELLPQRGGRSELAVGVEIDGERAADGAGNVPGHRIERLDVAAIALRAAGVDQRQCAGGERGDDRRRCRSSARPGGSRTAHCAARGRRWPPAVRRAATLRSRRRAPRPRRARASAASTTAGTRRRRSVGRRRRPAGRLRCPGARTSRQQASGVGSGWRPLRPVFGPDRSRSRWANSAPGMCPARYCSSPQRSGCESSWRTSTTIQAGSARCAASSVTLTRVVGMGMVRDVVEVTASGDRRREAQAVCSRGGVAKAGGVNAGR